MEFRFKLNSTDFIKDTQEFKRLSAECDGHIHYCQGLLRDCCKRVAKLEHERQNLKLREFFSEAVYLLSTAFIKNYSPLLNTETNYLHLVVSAFHRELCQLIELRDAESAASLLSLSQTSDATPPPITETSAVQSSLLQCSGFCHLLLTRQCLSPFF